MDSARMVAAVVRLLGDLVMMTTVQEGLKTARKDGTPVREEGAQVTLRAFVRFVHLPVEIRA
jgi:hypothetical protein